jgi:ribosome maturation factor RimP
MIDKVKLAGMIGEMLEGTDKFLVELVVQSGNRISVFIDGDLGVSIEDCRSISHRIEENLNRDAEDFDLTVSSAGLDRPLTMPRQFRKNVGRSIEIISQSGEKSEGKLIAVTDEGIEITSSIKSNKKKQIPDNQTFPFGEIKKATIKVEFKK